MTSHYPPPPLLSPFLMSCTFTVDPMQKIEESTVEEIEDLKPCIFSNPTYTKGLLMHHNP